MGGASAFGFVGLVYICSHWFAEEKRGILIGLASSIGMLGAVMGQGPLRTLINTSGWRLANIELGILGLIIAAVIYLIVRNDPPEMAKYDEKMKKGPPTHILANLKVVAKNGYSWLNAIVSLFMMIATPGFAGLWGIPFIHSAYGISTETAGYAVSMIFIGWAVGGPVIGKISDYLQQKKSLMIAGSLLGALLMIVIIYVPSLPLSMLFFLLFLVGFTSSCQLLPYSYAIDINPPEVKATAVAFTNFITYLGAALVQPLVGYLLDLNWTGKFEGGARVYSPEAYKIALSCFPIAFLLAVVLGFFLKKPERPKTLWQKYFT
jgi:sugar phosphate permease